MKKRIDLFLTNKDEKELSFEIQKIFPATLFIDDNYWETEMPPAKSSIIECNSKFVYIWNKDIYPKLPFMQRKDGKFQGPQVGMVIQFLRPYFKDSNTLMAGSMGISVNNEDGRMLDFVKQVLKILKKVAPEKPIAVNPETLEVINNKIDSIVVGRDAAEWCNAERNRFMRFDNSYAFLKSKGKNN